MGDPLRGSRTEYGLSLYVHQTADSRPRQISILVETLSHEEIRNVELSADDFQPELTAGFDRPFQLPGKSQCTNICLLDGGCQSVRFL
jgi:hypothetical protein